MANLLASLVASTGALRAYDKVLQTTQNNVANASTPGYARQRVHLSALPFDPDHGTPGGVWAGEVRTARDEYAEAAVRRQTTALGHDRQSVGSLTGLEGVLGIEDEAGIPAALTRLYQTFSDWSVAPNEESARQAVIDRAQDLVRAFHAAAAAGQEAMRNAENQARSTVERINQLAGELVQANRTARQGAGRDAGVDAQLNNTLEELAQYAEVTVVPQDDGTTAVLLGGQVPLVVGERQYALSFSIEKPDDPPPSNLTSSGVAVVRSYDESDVTTTLGGGQIGALLDFRNRVLAGIMGDPWQQGDVNRLAQAVADRINEVLTSGVVSAGLPPAAGSPLFEYDAAEPTAMAASLHISAQASAGALAAIDPGPPAVSNGIPLRLAGLASGSDAGDRIGSLTFVEYYGMLAGRIGGQLADAKSGEELQQSLVAQAKDLRQQSSGVSLDEEAVTLIQFQRAYQASARLVSVIDQLTEEIIGMLR